MADRSASEAPRAWPSALRYGAMLPLLAGGGLSLHLGGPWVWAAPVVVLGVLPIAEMLLPEVHEPPVPSALARRPAYESVPYLLAIHQFWMVGSLVFLAATQRRPPEVIAGMILTVGMAMGGIGLNVAHDFGHRASKASQRLSLALLATMLYGHWRIEHTRGHHGRVGTPEDPATARQGESLYGFALRSGLGGLRSAWRSEADRLKRQGKPALHFENEILVITLVQLGLVVGIGALAGSRALGVWLAAVGVAILLTESVNYVQHYGLMRKVGPDGRLEPAHPGLSWCSDRVLSRVVFLELPRHGDHHSHPTRPYPELEHTPTSPHMPLGLLGQILLSLFPWAFFRVMDPRLNQVRRERLL